jgi:SAM-dependent methyltransferase
MLGTRTPWEEAYRRFETASEERRKFVRRLTKFGARSWSRDARIVELFCGRGNGLHALTSLGFDNIEGVDLSPSLLASYVGPARTYIQDCRALPFEDGSRDVVVIHGGLHHLEALPADLDQTLSEARRVLRVGGVFAVVEPWSTPFLRLVHAACSVNSLRVRSEKLDALATMIALERATYEQWLRQPELVFRLLCTHFPRHRVSVRWGKLSFLGEVARG